MHLVIDDESPVLGVKQLEVRVDPLASHRQHLVGRDGDWPDLLPGAAVLADLVLGEAGAPDQLGLPLTRTHRVGHQDQRGGLRLRHRRGADQGLARSAGEYDDPGTSVPERVGSLPLVGTQRPLGLVERDGVCLAVDVAGEVLRGPAELEQRLLEVAALAGMHRDRPHRVGQGVETLADHPRHLLGPDDLLEHRLVEAAEHQPVNRVLVEPEPAVARHRLRDVDEQRVRNGIAAEGQQHVDHLLGVVPGGARVPQPQRRQPVGVDVLGAALQLGEGSNRLATGISLFVVDLEQQGLVRLDDQGAIIHQEIDPTDRWFAGAPRPGSGKTAGNAPAKLTSDSESASERMGLTTSLHVCLLNLMVPSGCRWWA